MYHIIISSAYPVQVSYTMVFSSEHPFISLDLRTYPNQFIFLSLCIYIVRIFSFSQKLFYFIFHFYFLFPCYLIIFLPSRNAPNEFYFKNSRLLFSSSFEFDHVLLSYMRIQLLLV